MGRSVEARAGSVDEAVALALSQLDVSRDRVDIVILDAGGRGRFGISRRAHVRLTVREDAPGYAAPEAPPDPVVREQRQETATPSTHPPTDAEENTVTTKDGVDVEQPAEAPEVTVESLDEEADLAADFLEGLLDLLDLPGDIEIEVLDEQALVTIQDVGSGLLIGRRGATLDALQELVRCAVQRQTEQRAHVRVDVEGYRARHLDKLRDKCREAIAEVRETGEPVRLEPMDAYERKLMHDLVAKTGGVTSSSEGSEPKRRVVIHPAE